MNTNAQVPLLSSLPSAPAVIFLDFDGHNVAGTSWNFDGPFYCGPSGLDNSQITTVFNRVAEDYRPFNVNITTDSTKFLAAPINRRMRVLLTVSYEWYGSAGGVGFIGSFTWGDDSPCFVFTSLLSYNVKNIAEAASHEAGHTLGLYHQARYDANCVKQSDYHSGAGAGEIGWAPIMGVGYYQNLTLWNSGPNPYGCNNIQNDLTVITSNNGFSYRTDDHTASFPTATTATFVNNQFTVSGVIAQNTDQDLFIGNIKGGIYFYRNDDISSVQNLSSGLPSDFNLYQNYPNPFNPSTKIKFDIRTNSAVKLSVFDVSGKELRVLVNENLKSGTYEYSFSAEGLSSGIYFYRLQSGNFAEAKSMLIVK